MAFTAHEAFRKFKALFFTCANSLEAKIYHNVYKTGIHFMNDVGYFNILTSIY